MRQPTDIESLSKWGIPFAQYGGVTLVERGDAVTCITQIVRSGCRFFGYDAFAVTADSIQPFMEFSPDWSRSGVPALDVILSQIQRHPVQITHYEFVFDPA